MKERTSRFRLAPVLIWPAAALTATAAALILVTAAQPDATAPSDATATCVICHSGTHPGLVAQWQDSRHRAAGIGCYECHQADTGDADAWEHNGFTISVIVTPLDCKRCHPVEYEEFTMSHHASGGNILASLDNFLAETVEGARGEFDAYGLVPGRADLDTVAGGASAVSGCAQCHGSKLALLATDGGVVTVSDLAPGPDGQPTNPDAVARIARDADGRPRLDPATWPNTGIGRLNLDGSPGSCSACHSRHDFSTRRARQPNNCGKCHQGPDHPQEEVYEESKHGIAFHDAEDAMALDSGSWILGRDYTAAPTCATCHMSPNTKTGGKVSHDVGQRLSWNNKAALSRWYDTDAYGNIVTTTDPDERAAQTVGSAWDKRARMQDVCTHCHSKPYVESFYEQYDEFIVLYNEKFARPGAELMGLLKEAGLITKPDFDDPIEWTWWELWHHEGRRARHGASMMGPDFAHWHGMYDVAKAFYTKFVPEVREIIAKARAAGNDAAADEVEAYLAELLARDEHAWFGAAE
ncbi:hydroxylamine oxidoreductase [bacterium]|nr:hydroxylamine oxidoreductase [bacterium]